MLIYVTVLNIYTEGNDYRTAMEGGKQITKSMQT
jgi:hypothetical protein